MTTDKKDMITVEIFKGKDCNFSIQLRWSAQKNMIKDTMLSETWEDEPGNDELRSCLDHTCRIKLQSYVKDLVYKMCDKKKSFNDYRSLVESLSNEQIEQIKEKAIDWQYGTTYVADKEAKKIENVDKALEQMAKTNPEEAKRMALKALEQLKAMGIEV